MFVLDGPPNKLNKVPAKPKNIRYHMIIIMTQNGDVKTEKVHHSIDEPKKFDIKAAIARMPEIGYINAEGYTVLPGSYYHEEDDIYEE